MKTIAAIAVAALAGVSVGALAAERTIGQKGRAFSEPELAIAAGDTVVFVNNDDVVHNVLSTSPVQPFNLGSQAPGASTPMKFNKSGEIAVLCAIHPRMRMKIKVSG
jgi:plastocyanin